MSNYNPGPMRRTFSGIHSASRLVARAKEFLRAALDGAGVGDIEPAHGDVLGHLYRQDGLSLAELARRSHRTKPTMTVLADKLERLGYVQRRPSETDRRAFELHLTAKSRRLRPVFERISDAMVAAVTANLTDAECAALESLLEKALSSPKTHKENQP